MGLHSLHAAALVSPSGRGALIVGPSGSGKSTLALGLVRAGWRYLSDDAVLIQSVAGRAVASALRKHFYIDAYTAAAQTDLPTGEVVKDCHGRYRRRVLLSETPLEEQHVPQCTPELIFFTRIVSGQSSTLAPVDQSVALKRLLDASTPQLFDHRTMVQHLATLKELLQQAKSFDLHAGLDLSREPAAVLARLLREAEHSGALCPGL